MIQETDQLAAWRGDFGNAYTERNVIDWRIRASALKKALDGLMVRRLLEVGCNRGHNLRALLEVLAEGTEIFGIEPNLNALTVARTMDEKINVISGNIFDLPFKDSYFDFVMTVGVLIHISPDQLQNAMREIARVSQRYIFAAEYYSETDTPVEYRGHDGLLWKGDFQKHYQSSIANLKAIRHGYWDAEDGFDRLHWWLFEKESPSQ